MHGIPPALPSDTEDVAWALQTAESLWKRGERVDAVVWLRRAAQAAGESDDAQRAATLGRAAAELGDWIASHTVTGDRAEGAFGAPSASSLEAIDVMLGGAPSIREGSEVFTLSSNDVEIVSSSDFEAGFGPPQPPPPPPPRASGGPKVSAPPRGSGSPGIPSDSEVMTVSLHAPDVEVIEDEAADAYEEEDTPAIRHPRSPVPEVPSAAEAHAGMLDPWAEDRKSAVVSPGARRSTGFEDEEVVTSARRNAAQPPPSQGEGGAQVPPAPKAPRFPAPRRPAPVAPSPPPGEPDTTTYRQINPRSMRGDARAEASRADARADASRADARADASRADARADAPRADARADARAEAPRVEARGDARVEPSRPEPRAPRPEPPRAEPTREPHRALPTRPDLPRTEASRPEPPRLDRERGAVARGPLGRPGPAAQRPEPARPAPPPKPPTPPPPKPPSERPAVDLLELIDSVDAPSLEEPAPSTQASAQRTPTPAPGRTPTPPRSPLPSAAPTPAPSAPPGRTPTPPRSPLPSAAPTPAPPSSSTGAPLPASARPTAPPPSSASISFDQALPSAPPTRPRAGETLLDLSAVEALTDLPDDEREAFGRAAKLHEIAREEEVSHFALALVVSGSLDVSAEIVDAPALRLEKNAILRSRGTLAAGVALRLVCASDKAVVATWDSAAVDRAFRSCPWVEEDLRAVADRVQAKVGMTMGPLGERFDLTMREHIASKLTIRSLIPGEELVVAGKPVPIAIVGIGELVLTKDGKKTGSLRPGDFVFPQQILGHGKAPATAAAGEGGAVVLYGDRAVSQELLMGFPPLLEVLATI